MKKLVVKRKVPIGKYGKKALLRESKGRCRYCRGFLELGKIAIDHIKPFAQGGEDKVENYFIVCQSCNSKKRDKTLEEYCGFLNLKGELNPQIFNTMKFLEKNREIRRRGIKKNVLKSFKEKYDIASFREIRELAEQVIEEN